ncbi:MAG TPA: histidine phosphatase family protein [Gaiellaceae bacterium]|nr:histidine phosphatase family protein [Gaiellaceae bacterium]
MTTLLLVRHGETDWNRDERFQGQADPPLNQTGRSQAVDLSVLLAADPLSAVYTSPLQRAFETAEIIAAAHGLEPSTVEALREMYDGSWEGLTRAEVEERFPHEYARWLEHRRGPGDGESYDGLCGRVVPAILEIAAAHPNGRVLAVTHAGPIRATLAHADGISYEEARKRGPAIENGSLVELAIEDGDLRRFEEDE